MNLGNYAFINTPLEPDPMFLRELSYQEKLSLLQWNVGQKTVAVKCDLCYFNPEGPACVSACPHKALILVTEEMQEIGEPASNERIEAALFEQMKAVAVVTRSPRDSATNDHPEGGR